MHGVIRNTALVHCLCALAACAHLVNVLDDVKIGMTRDQAVASAKGRPTPSYLRGGSTEYVLFSVVTNFHSMYGEYPNDILYIRLENGRVVDKGVVGAHEEVSIRKVSPTFVLSDWQRKDHVLPTEAPNP